MLCEKLQCILSILFVKYSAVVILFCLFHCELKLMDVYGCSRTKYDIPLNHLDYSYISSCNDKNELEKIIKILRLQYIIS